MGTPDHPMRIAGFFDGMAEEWHTRNSPQRVAVVTDALVRGLDAMAPQRGLAVEVGSGIGTYSPLLVERFTQVVAVDLSLAMLRLAPRGPAHRVQADGAALPIPDASAAAVVLVNAFLFPAEVTRVLAPAGVLVWVNCSGEQTPIYLSVDDLVAALPGEWAGLSSRAGEGHWCALRRA
jgi:SAM-dependent methyltransferase